jgi:hypothetical protein
VLGCLELIFQLRQVVKELRCFTSWH